MKNTSGNRSSAVRQQRREPHDSLDYFPTPPWATRALCEFLENRDYDVTSETVWEPACGGGHMAAPLWEYFAFVYASDVSKYDWLAPAGEQDAVCDFLIDGVCDVKRADWVITNPPFRLAEEFTARAAAVADVGFAMLVRSAFLEGKGRYANLYSQNPPSYILQFTERVPMQKNSLNKNLSTATSYSWLVWIVGDALQKTEFLWIAPCRARLEMDRDYPDDECAEEPGPMLAAMEAAQ